jgi:hypothetical protein
MFPTIDPAEWAESGRHVFQPGPGDDAPFTLLTYERISTGHRVDG